MRLSGNQVLPGSLIKSRRIQLDGGLLFLA